MVGDDTQQVSLNEDVSGCRTEGKALWWAPARSGVHSGPSVWSEILGQLRVIPPQVKTEYRLLNAKLILFADYVKSAYQYLWIIFSEYI